MAAPKRTAVQIEHDRAEIARRYLRGETQASIGAALGMTRQMVGYDLQVIEAAWRQSALFDLNAARARELAKIDQLERTYWEAWEDSKQDREIATQKQRGVGQQATKDVMLRREGQSGNPAFLAGVLACIERRCKLLGIDVPEKNDGTSNQTNITIQVAALDYRAAIAVLTPPAPGSVLDSDAPGEGEGVIDGETVGQVDDGRRYLTGDGEPGR